MPKGRPLPSAGITRPQRSYGPVRRPIAPPPACGVRGGEPRPIGPPPITRIALPACCAHYPGGPKRVRLPASFPVPHGLPRYPDGSASASLLSRPAQALLTLRPTGSLSRPSRLLSQGFSPSGYPHKLPVSYSIKPATIEVEPSSTGNTRLRGALGKGAQARSDLQSRAIVRAPCPRVRRAFALSTDAWARRHAGVSFASALRTGAFAHPLMSFVNLGGATALPLHKRARSCWYDDRATVGAKP